MVFVPTRLNSLISAIGLSGMGAALVRKVILSVFWPR